MTHFTKRFSNLPDPALSALCLLGLYQAFLGIALLVTPHWFASAVYEPWNGFQIPIGLAFLAGGTGLSWIAILPVRQPLALILIYLLAAINFAGLAALFARSGALHGEVVYGVLATGTLLIACLHIAHPGGVWHRIVSDRPLATIVHLIAFVTGLLMVVQPAQYGAPYYAPMRPWLPLFGAGFAVLGGVLFVNDLVSIKPVKRMTSLISLVLIGLFVWWGLGFVSSRVWTGVMTYALLVAGAVDTAILAPLPGWRNLQNLFSNPLRRRVALMVATVLIATAVVLTLALTSNNAVQAREDATDNAEILAGTVAEQLEFYLETHLAIVGQVADLPPVRDSELELTALALRETQAAFPEFRNIAVVDLSGQQIVRSTDGDLVNLGGKPYIQRALAGDPLVFGGVTNLVLTGEPVVTMAAPIRDMVTDEIRGAVSASIQLPAISEFLNDMEALNDREIILISRDGFVVARSQLDSVVPRDTLAGTSAFQAVQDGDSGTAQYALDGQRYLAGYARIEPSGWTGIVQQEESIALANVWRVEDRAYVVLLVASVLLVGLSALLVDHLFRPVVALIEPLQAIGEGRYGVALPVAEGQVGDLVRAFERMRGDLHDREMALASSESRYRSLIENGSDVVIVVNGLGVVQMVTPTIEHALGYTATETVGTQHSALNHPDDLALAAQVFTDVRASPGSEQRSELRFQHSGGTWRWFETVMQNRLDDPSVSGIVISMRDVTEQRRLRDEQDRLYVELEAELARAAEIQAQLLPHAAPDLPGYEFAAICLPARQVGGDFYDWLAGDDAIRLSLGDVMGKGMAAALLTATARAALRAVEDLPVSAAVEAVNRALSPDLMQSDSFVTLFHAALEPESGRLTYVDAGHGMVFIQRRDGSVQDLRQRGLPLGVLSDALYPASTTTLEPGDTLVVYSDGLPDARPEMALDTAGVARQIVALPDAQAKLKQLVSLVSDIQSRPDDLTLVLLLRREQLRVTRILELHPAERVDR